MTPAKKKKYIDLLVKLKTNYELFRSLTTEEWDLINDLIYDLCGKSLFKFSDLDKIFDVKLADFEQRPFKFVDNMCEVVESYEVKFKDKISFAYNACTNKGKKPMPLIQINEQEAKQIVFNQLLKELEEDDEGIH